VISAGIHPAAVTPFTDSGSLDFASLARLLARFESEGCAGVVLAGTTGEGASLSAIEKRDLARAAVPLAGKMQVCLGLATNSLPEALWLADQAAKSGVSSLLVSPPPFFANSSRDGLFLWLEHLLDGSPIPLILYHFPQKFGIGIEEDWIAKFADHPNLAGLKNSSGNPDNLSRFRELMPTGKRLFTGAEPLLLAALNAGWDGSISGASNVFGKWLNALYLDFVAGEHASAQAKFALMSGLLTVVRSAPQPATHKALLAHMGVLSCGAPRLPLLPVCAEPISAQIRNAPGSTGIF